MLRQHGHNYGDGIWSIRLWSVKFECDQISYLDNWIKTGAVNRIVKTVVKHYLTWLFFFSSFFMCQYDLMHILVISIYRLIYFETNKNS